jgi:hypothetical protein
MSYFMLVGLATHFNMTSSVCPELEVDSEPRSALAIAMVGVCCLSSSLPLCVISFLCRLSQIVRKRQNSQKTTGVPAPWTTSSLSTNLHQDNGRRSKMPQSGSRRNRGYLFRSLKVPMLLPSMREDLCLKRTARLKSETGVFYMFLEPVHCR